MIDTNTKNPHRESSKRPWRKSIVRLSALPIILLVVVLVWLNSSKTKDGNKVLRKLSLTYPVGSVAISPNGEMVAAGEGQVHAELRIWNFETNRLLSSIKTNHNGGVGLIAFSPDNKTLVTNDLHDGNQLFLWDAETGKRKGQLTGAQWLISSLFFSPNGTSLVNAGRNRNATVEVWDVPTGRLLHTLTESRTGIAFAFPMPDSKTMLIVSDNGIKLRDLRSYQLLRSFPLNSSNTKENIKAALSPNGKVLAIGIRKGQGAVESIELWDVSVGKRQFVFSENMGSTKAPWNSMLQALTFSPDGKILASSSADGGINLRDVQSGKMIRTLKPYATSLSFSPDGKTLAAGVRREVYLWNLKKLDEG